MPQTEYKAGSIIFKEGDPANDLSLITKGDVEVTCGEHTFRLEKADVVGLCDLGAGTLSHTYKAVTDVSLVNYPYEDFSSVDSLLRSNADIAYLTVKSMCHQMSECLRYRAQLKRKADYAYKLIHDAYNEYSNLCKQYAFTPKKLPGMQNISQINESNPLEDWTHDYYMEIRELDTNVHHRFFYNKPGISSGFLRKSAEDIVRVIESSTVYLEYTASISHNIVDKDGHDLFSLISDLHLSTINIKGADEALEEVLKPVTELVSSGLRGIDPTYYQSRLDAYHGGLADKRDAQPMELADAPVAAALSQDLVNSMDTILSYSGCDDEFCNKYRRYVQMYTELEDKTSTDDEMYDMRKTLVSGFYELYKNILIKSFSDNNQPTVVKMFLKFGYIDPSLAGYENANFLFGIADSYKGKPESNIFTVSEWLAAVYAGKVEPSLSEFEMDYQGYVKELKQEKRLDDKEVKRLLADQEGKLRFEMENAFPVVNKVTSGQSSRFVPLFSEHNLQRKIENLFVTPDKIKEIVDEIRSIDFSAFYRETSFSDTKTGVNGESINVEVLPNIILMPTTGTRGSMWQEIEGRLRTTPARMFMPVVLEGDLKQLILRLTGEFRWEMCKRVQGSRWGDVTDPSLTSFYTDYLQFYQNNRSIPAPVITAIRNELSSARNNYKTVFVQNYTTWIVNEANGSARLNDIAIGILMQFCPFASNIRERLGTNMRYNAPLQKYNIRQKKRMERVAAVIKFVRNKQKQPPQEIMDEYEYLKK